MNQLSHNFAKHEGMAAKHLRRKGKKPMRINEADVAELVDARDLKSPAPIDRAEFSFKIHELKPAKAATEPILLQNILEGRTAMNLDLENTRRDLIARRIKHGADTPIGPTCSNLIEQIEGMFGYVRPEWAKDVRQTLPWLINQQIKRLAAN